MQAHDLFSNIDVKAVIRALFGSGEFDDAIGDVRPPPPAIAV